MKAKIEDWFHKYSDDLYGWAYHKTSSKEVAEDLVQETFLSAVKGSKNFQNRSNPKTWLFAILNNKIIDYYRKKAKSASVMNDWNINTPILRTLFLIQIKIGRLRGEKSIGRMRFIYWTMMSLKK